MPDNSDFVKCIADATFQIIAAEEEKVKKACLIVEGAARQKCPKDTGVLAASLTSEVEMTGQAIVGRIGSNLDYAPYVHQGTGIYAKDGAGRKTPWSYTIPTGTHKGTYWTCGQKPQPFLEDAKTEKRGAVERALGD